MKNILLAFGTLLLSSQIYAQCVSAVCQDITVYLDQSGTAIIVGNELDGGSSISCGGSMTFSASQNVFTCSDITFSAANDLVITAVYDGPLAGGTPKGIELYAINDIPDLSLYGVSSANNGGGATGAPEYSFPADALTAGQYIYVATEAVEFANFFGFAPDYTSGSMSINGDDAIELFYMGAVIDVFGDVNVDGTGQAWDYLDGWVYRNTDTGPDGSTFNISHWTFSGINALDNETTNATSANPVPIGTYTFTPVDPILVTLTVSDGIGNSDACVANVTVLDILAPVITCQNITVALDANGSATITPEDLMPSSNIYFTATNSNQLYVAPLDGSGSPIVLYDPAASSSAGPVGMDYRDATDELYWGGGNQQELWVGAADGSGKTALSNAQGICCEHHDVDLDEANSRYFFTVNNNGVFVGNIDGSGTPTQIYPNNYSSGPNTVDYDETTMKVYTNDITGNVILKMDDNGANLIELFNNGDGVDGPRGIVIDESTQILYWTNRNSGDIMAGSADGLVGPMSVYSGRQGLYHITLDPATDLLYWTEFDGNGDRVMVAPKDGSSAPDTLYTGAYGGIRGITLGGVAGTPVENCGGYTSSVDISNFSCTDIGTPVSVTLTVTDDHGNSASCTSIVTVVDNEAPNAVCQDVTIYLDGSGLATVTEGQVDAGSTDACGPLSYSLSQYTFTCSDIGATPVDLTVIDASGNVSVCTSAITVLDTISPEVPIVIEQNIACGATPVAPTTTDQCAGTITGTTTTAFPLYVTTIITWTFDDGNGNTSTVDQTVFVDDTVDPVADLASLPDLTDSCSVDPVAPTATDACVGTITGVADVALPVTTPGTTVITWTYDDGNGNVITQTQNVTVLTIDATASYTGGTLYSVITNATSYQWYDCTAGTNINGANSESYVPTQNGDYAVIVTDNGCTDTSACITVSDVGLNELVESLLMIYPNPVSSNTFQIQYDGTIDGIKVTDATGREVPVEVSGEYSTVEVEKLENGTYWVEILTGNDIIRKQIVITK